MKKKLMAAVMAGVLAVAGVALLVLWAMNANDRAFDGAELVTVVRVVEPVPQGTSAAELAGLVETDEVPVTSVPDGAIESVDEVAGLAATARLLPGEVVLRARFAAPGDSGAGKVDVPAGLQEITFSLEGQRVVGGQVKAGDKVGVFGTYDPEQGDSWANLVSHDVLVTRVDQATTADASTAIAVTVAVGTELAEKIAFTMDFGRMWLSLQNADTDKSGERVIIGADLQ
ncbi:Flp pilus assembly protein CpaB [Aeromicrobium marinum]|uniref:Flp pilus assembly protein CpaB n=1 Tax=Aeromicrobium marinum TaxID=219314 RepID=UPI0001BCD449|nr:RcpC/CpaB family pilus assembly protein [Aeromicrobium marinum]